jgi:hypothetical protein
MKRLTKNLPAYEKGAGGVFAMTCDQLKKATPQAQKLAEKFNAHSAPEPYTAVHQLVTRLTTMRS